MLYLGALVVERVFNPLDVLGDSSVKDAGLLPQRHQERVSPGTRQFVVHGGANNGFQTGDTLAISRIMREDRA